MSNFIRHPFHLVDESPWPLAAALGALGITLGLVQLFHEGLSSILRIALLLTTALSFQWWLNIGKEGALQGLHLSNVETGLRYGMVLFIISEVIFFFSFFWAFFYRSVAPAPEIGASWPPAGIMPFNPFEVPLLNTIILLSSGVSVTWAHHGIIRGAHSQATQGLLVTIILGLYFTALQALEYFEASFTIADRAYGATFFVATGFHGLHVIVGTTFLIFTWIRAKQFDFRINHHFGFEAAAWYWHFVDVVWLFLFITVYWWGGAWDSSINLHFTYNDLFSL